MTAPASSTLESLVGHRHDSLAPSVGPTASARAAQGGGAQPGTSDPGFDVTGSHPLPNASTDEPPGRGACGCELGGARPLGSTAALIALLCVVITARRLRMSLL